MGAFQYPASRWSIGFYRLFFVALALVSSVVSVKHELFKTCEQSGFCKRNRALADHVGNTPTWQAPYALLPNSLKWSQGQLQGTILKTIDDAGQTVNLPVTISFQESGSARVTVDEEKRQKGDIELQHGSKIQKGRYNGVEKWSIAGGLGLNRDAHEERGSDRTVISYGPDNRFKAIIHFKPFSIEFQRDGATQIKLNDRGFFSMEHWRAKVEKPVDDSKEGEDVVDVQSGTDDSTWWEETFGGNTDTKPRGPESVGMDISFPGYEHVYGIPEHASSMSLKETRGGKDQYEQPYRLYNLDVFEYIMDSPMALYGAIPFMTAQKKNSTVGVYWMNAAETWIDIVKPTQARDTTKTDTKTHWFSESGLIDIFIMLGPTPKDVLKTYGGLTGYTVMPPEFAIGYHQCRWNYVSDEDVKDVDRRMDKHNVPYDVIWLDIEYTDGKKYFTWDPLTFPDPDTMISQLGETSRKLVTIIDPHIKNEDGYYISEQLRKQDLAAHDKDGKIYQGWCWPGNSNWVDAFNPAAIKWWISQFRFENFKHTFRNVFLWVDMNEPSVFNGPETTMPKDNIHYDDWEHRDVHNINGLTFHNASYKGLINRGKGETQRPFVLTRSFFAGSQRLSAVWTGDNQASWPHLQAAYPMIINNGISGYPFIGADVGGFFGNPEVELLTRWYQSGIFYPFFRAHAHLDTRRREPYLIDQPYRDIITRAIRLRYNLLAVYYTAFHSASIDGTPILQPNYFVHPDDEAGFALDDQAFIGNSGLLTKPVVDPGKTSVDMYLSDNELYYDYFDYNIYTGKGMVTIPAAIDQIPLLMQGGRIFPRKDRPRRSSGQMKYDPYTLVVVLGNTGAAVGELYFDDGESFSYQQGAYIHRAFQYTNGVLISRDVGTKGKLTDAFVKDRGTTQIERVVVVGAPAEWKERSTVKLGAGKSADLQWHVGGKGKASWAVVRRPGVKVGEDWRMDFS